MYFTQIVTCSAVLVGVLVVSVSSWVVSQYRQIKADDGSVMCGMSSANKTLNNVEPMVQCVSRCNQDRPPRCQAINYWTVTKLCELFYYTPCSYDAQQGCANYQVTISGFLPSKRANIFSAIRICKRFLILRVPFRLAPNSMTLTH